MSASRAELLAELPDPERAVALAGVDIAALTRSWAFWARPEQLAPTDPSRPVWLIQTGRGWGKNRTGSETVLDRAEAGLCRSGGLCNRTLTDVRALQVEGESGLVACAERRGLVADYIANRRTVEILAGRDTIGSLEVFTAEEPDSPRGRNLDTVWGDEVAAWAPKVGAHGVTCLANILLALRAGPDPFAVLTTTPKPTQVMRDLNESTLVSITRGTLYDNAANLADVFIDQIVGSYVGTRLEAQEILGILVMTVEGAMWSADGLMLDRWTSEPGPRVYTTVGVDPPTEGGECGIIVAALYQVGPRRLDIGVVADYSLRGDPNTWAAAVVRAVGDWDADLLVVEKNQGGRMVANTIRSMGLGKIPVRGVTAKQGKAIRAQPLAVLSERHRVHIVGDLPLLEAQLTGWVPPDQPDGSDWSPDRLDALVHAAEPLRSRVLVLPARTRATRPLPGVRAR